MDTDQIAAEAAWTDDTVYDLLAEAFESGGEIRGGQLIAQRHNETVQSAIEKAVEQERQRWQNVHHDYIKLIESRAAHASEQGTFPLWEQWRELLSDGKPRALCWNCGYPELIGSDDCRNCSTNFHSKRIALSQRPTPATASEPTNEEAWKEINALCRPETEYVSAHASEQGAVVRIKSLVCSGEWYHPDIRDRIIDICDSALSQRPTPATTEQASIERGLRILGRKPYPPATSSERPWSEVENSIGSNCPRKPPHAGGIGLSPATASERPFNSELATTMLNEGDFEGLAHEVARPNLKPDPASVGKATDWQDDPKEVAAHKQFSDEVKAAATPSGGGKWHNHDAMVLSEDRGEVAVAYNKTQAKKFVAAHNQSLQPRDK